MIEVLSKSGDPDVAFVHVARFGKNPDRIAEFVDVCDPQNIASKKWVVIISSQIGCPVACRMCDAGGNYKGDLSAHEMMAQVDYLVSQRPGLDLNDFSKFKVQFARMGEPALNGDVLEALKMLYDQYGSCSLIPCVATVAPASSIKWFESLIEIRKRIYRDHDFQLQLSINSTDEKTRDWLMPIPKLSLGEIGDLADEFFMEGKRKVCLNFALARDIPVEVDRISKNFDARHCVVKLTPLNPTIRSKQEGLTTALPVDEPDPAKRLRMELGKLGFEVIISIGDLRENKVGSNCGMAVIKYRALNQ